MKKSSIVVLLLLSVIAIMQACSEEPLPDNPFKQNAGGGTNNGKEDSISFVYLYKNIFNPRCNNPGCHDGTFEPDYRTIQSAYTTMLWKGLNKVSVDGVNIFQYRVIPYDTANSFLHERLTTYTSDYMPSNGVRLGRADINLINRWIMRGAQDPDGKVMPQPDLLPSIQIFAAFDNASGDRIDTNRINKIGYESFLVPQGTTLRIWVVAQDDFDSMDKYAQKQIRISTNKDNFNNALTFEMEYKVYGTFKVLEAIIPTGSMPKGSVNYLRIYLSDAKHSSSYTEFPMNNSEYYFKSYYSFKVN